MKKQIAMAAVLVFLSTGAAQAMKEHGSGGHGEVSKAKQPMNHGEMQHTPGSPGDFTHIGSSEGIKAEFQVMSLERMNIKDPSGATHHVMVKITREGNDDRVTDAVGKVKVISPSKKETVVDLTNYSGTFAANFTADEQGMYGIICLLKTGEKKPVYKFWYSHK